MGYGFAAIIVAFVGRLSPIGVIFSSLLMSMFYIGGELAQSRMGLPKSLTLVFQGVLLFALLASDTLIHSRIRWLPRRSGLPKASAAPVVAAKVASDKAKEVAAVVPATERAEQGRY
jgi:simple sugar transport system permease protein